MVAACRNVATFPCASRCSEWSQHHLDLVWQSLILCQSKFERTHHRCVSNRGALKRFLKLYWKIEMRLIDVDGKLHRLFMYEVFKGLDHHTNGCSIPFAKNRKCQTNEAEKQKEKCQSTNRRTNRWINREWKEQRVIDVMQYVDGE